MPTNTIGSTAGKWRHRTGNVYFQKLGNLWTGELIIANEYRPDEMWVATVWQNDHVDQQQANAKLIAKAPEMAEALTALLLINENHPRYKQESENALRILREAGAL